jgi:hypothetical protein
MLAGFMLNGFHSTARRAGTGSLPAAIGSSYTAVMGRDLRGSVSVGDGVSASGTKAAAPLVSVASAMNARARG